jgi:four helix bundle protein
MPAKSYRDLDVWQRAMELVEAVYRLSAKLPSSEQYGLRAQMQRAAVSVPANIAEGYGRTHRGDYLHHLSIAKGSLAEAETHLLLAVRLKLLNRSDAIEAWRLSQKVCQMLTKLVRALRPDARNPKPETRNPTRA